MIGSYRGSSGADEALKNVVEAMVMPAGFVPRMGWPVFPKDGDGTALMTYQRRDTRYVSGQQSRLLEIENIVFDIFIWSPNENMVQSIMDHLESGFNSFPLRDGFQSMREHLGSFVQSGPVPTQTDGLLSALEGFLPTGSVSEQETNLARVNRALADLTSVAKDADWGAALQRLGAVQSRITQVPPYNFHVDGCRDLVDPQFYQLGLSGRVFSVVAEFTAAN